MYTYVCESADLHITVDIHTSRVAHITLYRNNKTAISRKYLLDDKSQERANKLVNVFCALLIDNDLRESRFESEEDTSDFFTDYIRSSLKRTYTKSGLLIWQAGQ